ncbi:MAG: prepilin-type N-terminal cleavage/methylation domain-containing protein, partial [Bradyrhizobium sp.]
MTWQSISRRGNAPSYVRTAGFTLVEMLLALAILGLLSVLLFGGFRFGLRAWEVGDRRLDRADEIVVVQNFLRRELSQIIAIPQGLGQPLAFWGEPKSVMFLAPLPERGNLGGIYALKIASAPAGSDEAPLVMAWQLFRPDMDLSQGMAPGQTYPLLTGVESISFSYYG